MALPNYPSSPITGQTFSLADGKTFQWDGEKWKAVTRSAISKQTTTLDLINNTTGYSVGETVLTFGYESEGDGGSALWTKTANTDTALQSPLVRQDGTFTDTEGAVWRLVVTGYLDPRAVGFVGTGDETAALKAAVAAVGEGGTVKLDKSYTFEIDGIEPPACCNVDLSGSTITNNTALPAFRMNGQFTDEVNVSSVTGDTIVVADASGYSVGDIVKITSSDEQPDFWTNNRFIGQFAVIVDKVGNTLTMDRNIIDDDLYVTNVKLFKLPVKSASVKNAVIKPSASLSDHNGLIVMDSLHSPTVENVKTVGSRDANFKFISCFGYSVIGCSSRTSLDSVGTSNFGYGVEDLSSDGGYIENYTFDGGRHAYTNNSFSIGSADPRCGYTTNTTVANSMAHNATSGAWDTHPGAINVKFIDCEAINCNSFGQSRSRKTYFINPYGRDLVTGFKASGGKTGSTINPLKDMVIVAPDIHCTEALIEHYASSAESDADPAEIRVEGGAVVLAGSYRGLLIESRNAPVRLTVKNIDIAIEDISTDSLCLITGKAGNNIYMNDIRLTFNGDGSSIVFAIVRPTSSLVGTGHLVKLQRFTIDGDGTVDCDFRGTIDANVYVTDIRVKDLGGSGSLVAAGGTGSLFTWGGVL